MKDIRDNFELTVKHFYAFIIHLSVGVIMLVVLLAKTLYRAMNGKFGMCELGSPYVYIWRTLTWGALVWATFTYVLVPFFAWWDLAMQYLNNLIFG